MDKRLCVSIIETNNPMDDVAAKQLYEKYGFIIYRTCLRILHSDDDAKDALQTVFLKLLEERNAIHDPKRIIPWIFKTAKNHCFNMLRYNKKFMQAIESDTVPCAEKNYETIESREIIKLIFKNHNKKVRDAVYFTYMEQFDQREIQKLTGQSPATIRRNLHRFKKSVSLIGKQLAITHENL
jgi:RNA polymerase sigma factor (sigma-70 family)